METTNSYRKLKVSKINSTVGNSASLESATLFKAFRNISVKREFSSISNLRFYANPAKSGGGLGAVHLACCSSTRVQIYPASSSVLQAPPRSISRFQDVVLCCDHQDSLLVCGDQSGLIQLFDLNSRSILRTLSGHKGPVRVVKFIKGEKKILSGSDDHIVRLWDVPSQSVLAEFAEHDDYVRAIDTCPSVDPNLILSGSYDHTVKLWDRNSSCSILTMDHGAPVESCLFLPGGGLAASSGSNLIKIWDITSIANGPKLLMTLSPHQKTITCMTIVVHEDASYLVSGSLDQQVKIIDLATFKVVGGFKYAAPIMCLAMSPGNESFAVGMNNGLLSVRKRVVKKAVSIQDPVLPRGGTSAHFNRHLSVVPESYNVTVTSHRAQKLKPVDRFLRGFRYGDALDSVLSPSSGGGDVLGSYSPELVNALLQELETRQALPLALANRDDHSLLPLLTYLSRQISHPAYQSTCILALDRVLDVYGPVLSRSIVLEGAVKKLKQVVETQVEVCWRVGSVCSSLEAFLIQAEI